VTSDPRLLPDALLIERVAALGDKTALGELDRRHGMTLYAIAYTLLLDSEASDTAVAEALRELWRQAASFDPRAGTAAAWMAELTRRAVRERMRASRQERRRAPRRLSVQPATPAAPAAPRRRPAGRVFRTAVKRAVRLAAAFALPTLLFR
jgi:DNA-directed RNA polymerase specialized sigma24 family protein